MVRSNKQKNEEDIAAEHVVLASNSIYAMFRYVSKFFISFVLSVLFVRFLGATNYGIFSIATLYWSVFLTIMTFGFGSAAQYGISRYRAKRNKKGAAWISIHYFWLLTIGTIIGSILMFLLSNPIAVAYRIPQLSLLLQLLAIGLVFYSISEGFSDSVYAAYQQMKYTFFKGLLFDALRIVQVIIVIIGFGLVGAIAFYTVLYIITASVGIYFIYRIIKPLGKPIPISKAELHGLNRYSSFTYTSSLIGLFYGPLITLVLGFFAPDASFVSFYRIGLLMASLVTIPASALSTPFFATITKYFDRKQYDNLYRVMNTVLRYTAMVTIPLIVGALVASRQIIQYLYHASLLGAETPFIIILGAALVSSLFGPLTSVISAIGKQKYFMYASIVGAVIGVTLNILLVPQFLANGAAAVYLISNVSITIVMLYFVSRYIELRLPYVAVLKSLLASLIMAAFIYFALNSMSTLAPLPFVLIAGLIVYIVLIYMMRLLTDRDVEFFLRLGKMDKIISYIRRR
ncbi:MAG: polysaccharide biosynthesis C-terminal domain-containing protein [Candidatus Parvarchaeota archaeon]|jgi:O-antigen/teichoic acid export membrane protein|nr:polysaccharide biosynthesis C-terminal domain-containing protein [Candidatus Parvarchaeota archaeon]MCL5101343.1 polysaccharide biosynthesis C-terminal domain-containing protein [Candidatus Parvarchaeota archaeon]